MPISVDWANNKHNIILTTFSGEWDLTDFYSMVDAGARLLKDVDYPFVTLVDYTNSITPPRKTLTIGQHVERVHNPHRIKVIFVKPGFLVERLYGVLGRLYPAAFGNAATVNSLEEAFSMAEALLQEAQKK